MKWLFILFYFLVSYISVLFTSGVKLALKVNGGFCKEIAGNETNRCENFSITAIEGAIGEGYAKALRYLHDNHKNFVNSASYSGKICIGGTDIQPPTGANAGNTSGANAGNTGGANPGNTLTSLMFLLLILNLFC